MAQDINNTEEIDMDDGWGGVVGDEADYISAKNSPTEEGTEETVQEGIEASEAKETEQSVEVQEGEVEEVSGEATEDVKASEGEGGTDPIWDEESIKQVKIKVKVDGEIKELTGEEAYKAISGGLATEKRFTALDKEKKELYSRIEQDQKAKQDFANKLKTDPLGALADFADQPVYALKETLIKAVLPELQRRQEMTPEQLDAYKYKQEAEYAKQKLDEVTEKERKQQEEHAKRAMQEELAQQVETAKKSLGVSTEEWDRALFELDRKLPEDQEITVEDVSKYIQDKRTTPGISATEILSSVIEPYESMVNDQFKAQLKQYIELNPGESRESIEDLVKQALAVHTKRQLLGETSTEVVHKPTEASFKSKKEQDEFNDYMEEGLVAGVWEDDEDPFI